MTAIAEAWRLYPHTLARRLSEGRWKPQAFHRMISMTVAAAILAGVACIIVIEAPPQHGKSELVSHWLPVWYLSTHPDKRVMLGAYDADFAAEWGRKVRNTLEDLTAELGVVIASDSSAADRWHTHAGGGMRTAGVGGGTVGRPGHLIVIDDPVKNHEEADSEKIREKHWSWFQTSIWTRRQPGTVIVLMHQRWRTDDLAGRVLSNAEMQKQTTRLHFPAIAKENDQLGRKPGEALWPDRYPVLGPEGLLTTRAAIEPRFWNALFQQSPTDEEGAEFKREWWKYYTELPVALHELDHIACFWDATFTDEQTSDFVVGGAIGVYGSRRYVLEIVRAKMDFLATTAEAKALHARWGAKVTYFEQAANGHACIVSLRKELHDHKGEIVKGIKVRENKVSRARSVIPIVHGGDVHLRANAAWAAPFVDECAAFPLGKNDDQVDFLSMALHQLRPWQKQHVSEFTNTDDRVVIPRKSALQQRMQQLIPLHRYG